MPTLPRTGATAPGSPDSDTVNQFLKHTRNMKFLHARCRRWRAIRERWHHGRGSDRQCRGLWNYRWRGGELGGILLPGLDPGPLLLAWRPNILLLPKHDLRPHDVSVDEMSTPIPRKLTLPRPENDITNNASTQTLHHRLASTKHTIERCCRCANSWKTKGLLEVKAGK